MLLFLFLGLFLLRAAVSARPRNGTSEEAESPKPDAPENTPKTKAPTPEQKTEQQKSEIRTQKTDESWEPTPLETR